MFETLPAGALLSKTRVPLEVRLRVKLSLAQWTQVHGARKVQLERWFETLLRLEIGEADHPSSRVRQRVTLTRNLSTPCKSPRPKPLFPCLSVSESPVWSTLQLSKTGQRATVSSTGVDIFGWGK